MLLTASGLQTKDNEDFILQPLERLISKLPKFVPKVARAVTDIANKATEVIGLGKGCSCGCHDKMGGSANQDPLTDLRKYLK